MRDLLLFSLLRTARLDDPRLPALLGELPELSVRDRAPFLPYLLDLLGRGGATAHALAPLAIGALRGAKGRSVQAALLDALASPVLRDAALDALVPVWEEQPGRAIHALFHADPTLRSAAFARLPERARFFDLYLLGDPVLGDHARARLARADAALHADDLPVLIAARRAGQLPKETAYRLIAAGRFDGLESPRLRARSDKTVAAAFAADPIDLAGLRAIAEEPDDLDEVVSWLPDQPSAALGLLRHQHRLVGAIAALWATGNLTQRSFLDVLAGLRPRLLLGDALSAEERARATRHIAESWRAYPRVAADELSELLRAPRLSRPDGGIDLALLGALLSLGPSAQFDASKGTFADLGASSPFGRAFEIFGAARLAEAVRRDPRGALPLLGLYDAAPPAREHLLARLEPEAQAELWCDFAESASAQLLEGVLAKRADLVALLGRLVRRALSAEVAAQIATSLSGVLGGRALALVILPALEHLASIAPQRSALADALYERMIVSLPAEDFAAAALAFAPDTLLRFFAVFEPLGELPLAKSRALEEALAGHADPRLAAWAHARAPQADPPPPPPRKAAGVAYGPPPPAPSVEAALQLLLSLDPPAAIDAAFPRFAREDPAFLDALEAALARSHAYRHDAISSLGHAVLWRFDFHALAHFDALLAEGSLADGLRARGRLTSPFLRERALRATASALAVVAMRERARFNGLVDDAVVDALIELLSSDGADGAIVALRAIAGARVIALGPHLAKLRLAMTGLSDAQRRELASVCEADGLAPRKAAAPREAPAAPARLVAIRAESDLARLVALLDDETSEIVNEATLRLLLLGDAGCVALAERLARGPLRSELGPVLASVGLWPEGAGLAALRALAEAPDTLPELAFRLALELADREREANRWIARALEAVLASERDFFLDEAGWARLFALYDRDAARADPASTPASRQLALAIRLAPAAEPHAYLRAVEILCVAPESPAVDDALLGFLAQGTRRMGSLRRRAARLLCARGRMEAFSVLLPQELEQTTGRSELLAGATGAHDDLVLLTARAFLAAGMMVAKEAALLHHLQPLPSWRAEPALEALLADGVSAKARMAAAAALSRGTARLRKLMRLVEVFQWGQRIGRSLLGRKMRVRMTGADKLGFTRLDQDIVYVTPLPLLRGDRNGREVVEALVLHELGHHLYHRSKAAKDAWATSEREGIQPLFNLVLDEHLERNLRATDESYGDRLKRLAAYAFQHTQREIKVVSLLRHVGVQAHAALAASELGLARDDAAVRVETGALLARMERAGLAFSRFVRALRMGLGNRHGDAQVERALALFAKDFRKKTPEELLAVARELKAIFGWETSLLEHYGPHEAMEAGDAESDVEGVIWGDGITADEVERMVERFTEKRPTSPGAGGGKLAINVDEDTRFNRIQKVIEKPHDPAALAPYKKKVERPASILRRYLEDLGLAMRPVKMRLAGNRLDRGRLLPLVLRGDPRVLAARTRVLTRDLFLGILIDCSGSMQSYGNIEKAKLFATLVNEATAPLPGVDVRVFGFTAAELFDCGDNKRSGVAGLSANGGNNDAAGLVHVAELAKRSRRKAKVLVMISDGLPTECTVAALKNLVQQLATREKFVLAQVAVQPIPEVCFPHFIVLNEGSIEESVRKFGTVVARLVRRAMTS